ncbi:hypothetical protein NB717_003556 [Xanthomonas sacchari]|nr:hypothetical protein [Xanthomonas sacchari]
MRGHQAQARLGLAQRMQPRQGVAIDAMLAEQVGDQGWRRRAVGERSAGPGRVGDQEHRAVRVLEPQAVVAGRMSGQRHQQHAAVAEQVAWRAEVAQCGGRQRRGQRLDPVHARARAVQQCRQETFAQRGQPAAALQIVPGLLRAGQARVWEIGDAADVVTMEMRQHDPADAVRIHAVAGELFAQRLPGCQLHGRQPAVQAFGEARGGIEEMTGVAGVEQQVALLRMLQQGRQRRKRTWRQRRAAARGALRMRAVTGFVQPPLQPGYAHGRPSAASPASVDSTGA